VISGSPKPLPTRRSRRVFPQQPQVSDSIDANFPNLLARPVYLLTSGAHSAPTVVNRSGAGRRGRSPTTYGRRV